MGQSERVLSLGSVVPSPSQYVDYKLHAQRSSLLDPDAALDRLSEKQNLCQSNVNSWILTFLGL